jgi:hypothetical protein
MGPFFVGSMWILKWTYGNFKSFLMLNIIIDAIFSFAIIRIIEKLKLATLVRINQFQYFLSIFPKAFLLYGFQYLFDKNKERLSSTNRSLED